VRGFERLLVERVQYLLKHAFNVPHHVIVPKSKDEIAACFQISGSLCILSHTIGMLTSIKFDHEPRIGTAEVDKESIE
jgi:hypothetical protein